MKLILTILASLSLALLSCQEKKPSERMSDDELRAFADELAHKYIIVDGHVDLPDHLMHKKFDPKKDSLKVLISTNDGDFDYERAVKGGFDAPFMSIYIPSKYQLLPDKGKAYADSLIDLVKGIAESIPDKFALAGTVQDVAKNFKQGKISLPMGMENGAPIGDDIKNVKYFHERGVRYITLTHGKDNQICDSSTDTTHTWNGLSPFGREVVGEMNRVGIMIDISHVADSTFYQVMQLSKAPCIASHSSCKFFAPRIKRDMTDDMIRKLGEKNGVMLINFYTRFLSDKADHLSSTLDSLLKIQGLKAEDPSAKPAVEQFWKDHPSTVDVGTVADHIDHVVQLAGIDHVGFGSDFDGVGGPSFLPEGLKDVSQYPNLIYTLLKRGYTESDIEKICSGNILRVWKKVAEVAEKS
jgi:membrane dipeptidase